MGSATGAEDETKNRNAGVDTGVALWRRSSFLVVLTMMTMTVMILCCDDWSVVWARFTTSRVALSTLSAIQLSRNERVAGLLWRRYRVFFFFYWVFTDCSTESLRGSSSIGPSRRRGRCQIKKKTKKGIENEKLKNKNKKKTERAERENDEPSATTKVNAFLFSDLSKRKIEKKTKIK